MIGSIGSGPNGGYTSLPYVSPNSNNPMTGMIRTNGGRLEVFDGNSWISFSGSAAEVSLNGAAIAALDWANRKMIEEEKIRSLADKSVAVADALATYEKAREQLNVVMTLADKK